MAKRTRTVFCSNPSHEENVIMTKDREHKTEQGIWSQGHKVVEEKYTCCICGAVIYIRDTE